MRALPITPLVLTLLLGVPGCPSSDPGNPKQLWLALNGSETQVQLVASEPAPF